MNEMLMNPRLTAAFEGTCLFVKNFGCGVSILQYGAMEIGG